MTQEALVNYILQYVQENGVETPVQFAMYHAAIAAYYGK